MANWDPDQFFMHQQQTACTPDGKSWIFEYLGFWYQSPRVCYRYLLRTEARDTPACADYDQQSFGTEYHITLELPITTCKDDMENFVNKLFKEPYPYLIVEHEVESYIAI